jgi:hypothetical protein
MDPLPSLRLFCWFAGEAQYVLEDEEYRMQYKSELRDAVMRAKERPNSLFAGYTFCLSKYIQPSFDVLSAIIKSTGGKVNTFILIGSLYYSILNACIYVLKSGTNQQLIQNSR